MKINFNGLTAIYWENEARIHHWQDIIDCYKFIQHDKADQRFNLDDTDLNWLDHSHM